MKRHDRMMPFLSTVLILNLVLAACGAGMSSAPSAGAGVASVVQAAAGSESKQDASLRDASVKATTPAQAIPLPPVVASVSPARGEEQPLDAPVIITFDQAMDSRSTQAAFAITPEISGEVTVTGAVLEFAPEVPFERDAAYSVTINDSARSAAGLAISEPFVHSFQTVGFLAVSSTQPDDSTTDVAVNRPITVSFNRPVVPLTGVSDQADLPQPLIIDPETEGMGEWLNTAIYQFTPKEGLAAATTYSVTVPAGLTDTSAAVLDQDYVFSFRTTDPMVTRWLPENNISLPIQSAISVTFSMPMDRASTEEAFSLRDDSGSAVQGAFNWSLSDTILSFKPHRVLEYGQRYTAEIDASALAANRKGSLRDTGDRSRGFLTVSLPEVVRTEPADGNLKADPMGGVAFYFKSPMDPRSFVTDSVKILPKPTRVYTGYNPYDNVLWVDFNKLPATAYTVSLSDKVADPDGNLLGEDYEFSFRTRDYDPMLQIETPAQVGTYNAYTETEAVVTYRNVPEIRFSLYNTTLDDYLRMTGTNWWEAWDRYVPRQEDLIRTWTEETTARPNRIAVLRSPLTDDEGQQLAPGFFYLELANPEMGGVDRASTRRLLARTDLNVTLKTGQYEALAWVTDLKSGLPVSGVDVRFFTRDKIDATITTDEQGLAHLEDMVERKPWETLVAVATTDEGGFGVASSEWQMGISPWDFNLPAGVSSGPYNAYVYTDRPIYRPGQTVYWKAIVRRDEDAQYSLPEAGQAMSVTINDDRGNIILDQRVTLTPQGTADGELMLAPDATLGYYYVSARLSDETSYGVGFQVAAYRKPEYELTASTDKPEYVQGEQINVTTQATYFFGGPVKEAKVKWVLLSVDQYFAPPGLESYSFGDWNWYDDGSQNPFGRELGQGEGVTDAEGRFTFSVPADIARFKQGQRFTFDITITDANNLPVSTQATALVHKGEFYVGLKPAEYVAEAGSPTEMEVLTVDPQGKPVANTDVTLVVHQVEWQSVREEAEDGRFYWVTRPKKTAIMTDTVQTNFVGEATLTWTPTQAGDQKIEAAARDGAGHAIRSAAWVWVTGPEYVAWRQENNDRIQLIPDQDEYEVGDTARVLVASPYQGDVMALLAIERGGILKHEVIELTGNSQVLELPVEADFAPNAFISLVIVKGMDATSPNPSFRVGLAELKASVADKELQVVVTPRTAEATASGVPQAGPREELTYDIQTLDQEGRPVSADVSLALVDKAVLSLADDQAGTLLDRFYSRRPDGIQTAATLVVNVDRLVAQVPEGGKGGGGGGMEAGAMTVRSEFLDLAHWQASVRTGDDGRAQVEVTLPDNLTTWTMDARAASPQTLVGQTKSDLIATKALLIRPSLPRFFVENDRAEIGGVIQNNTEQPLEVRASLQVDGLAVTTPMATDATIAANGNRKITWPVTVDTRDEAVTITMAVRASTGGLSDAVELTLPVYRYSTPEVVGTSGEVDPGEVRLESILVPKEAEIDRGGLDVIVEPSLAAGMSAGLNYLEHYPYECVEQTMSRFLPNVVTYAALSELGIERPGLEMQLRQQVSVGLQKIYAKQHTDGGWGWWQTDDSSLAVTAYVVFGLAQARESRFAVDPVVLDRATRFLQQNLKSPEGLSSWQANQQAFIVYALAEAGVPEPNRAGVLYEQREKLSLYAKAYLAMALDLIGDDAAPARIATLLDEISGEAVTSATATHWEEDFVDYRNMNTDVRTTAIVLDALARLDPRNALAPNAVRWLMAVRSAGRWDTTQENAWSIMALTDWMSSTGELEGRYTWNVRLNGAEMGHGDVRPETIDETTVLQAGIEKLLRDGANALQIERGEGPGQMYYSAYLRTYLPVDDLEPQSRGVTVTRFYRLAECGVSDDEACPPTSSARVGDVLEAVVDIVAPNTLHYLVVEDPLPAGLEAIDTSLRTTSVTAEGPEVALTGESASLRPGWWWTPTDVELRDEKTGLFATELAPGSYRFIYQLRATLTGEFLTLPPTGYQMYFPEVWGRGAGSVFTVTD